MHAVLEYTYADNYLESREQYRADHLGRGGNRSNAANFCWAAPLEKSPSKGLLIFTGDNALEAAKAFAAADPYVINGVVTEWTASPWTTVLGNEAASPVRP